MNSNREMTQRINALAAAVGDETYSVDSRRPLTVTLNLNKNPRFGTEEETETSLADPAGSYPLTFEVVLTQTLPPTDAFALPLEDPMKAAPAVMPAP